MRAARCTPELEAGHSAEDDQCLAHRACGSMHENALASLDPGRAMKELICGCPAQDQRGRLGGIDARRHADHVAGPQRAIGGIRPDHRHISDTVTNMKSADTVPELINFSNQIITHYEWWPAGSSLRIEVTPD
jgi:hypothetical protein